MLKCKYLYYIEIQVLSTVFLNFKSLLIRIFVARLLQLFCVSFPLLHDNRGSFSYLSHTTAYKI